jgi:hypothetical protein
MGSHSSGPAEDIPQPSSVRAQLLATEHWSLLASRSTAQSEVLSRIAILLTLVSAGLVSLALVGQATEFSDAFIAFAIGVLAFIVLVGLLTGIRVMNIGMEDLMYVVAMNRLRGAYVELDPGLDRILMASPHDDFAGVQQTYYFFSPKRGTSQVFGSTMMFITLINGALIGLLVASISMVFSTSTPLAVVLGALLGLGYSVVNIGLGKRKFDAVRTTFPAEFPSPA